MSLSDTNAGDRKPGLPVDALGLVGVLVLAVVAMLFFAGNRSQEIRRSPSGFDGLAIWLTEGGTEAQSFTGGWTIPVEDLGLNIVPLYDTALGSPRVAPTTKEELLFQKDEIDLEPNVVLEKVEVAPTMLVLPKWRTGVRLTGLAHPALLIPGRDTARILPDVMPGVRVRSVRQFPVVNRSFDYTTSNGRVLRARLYVPQVLDSPDCTPVIGRPGAIVLGECQIATARGTKSIHVLADPDLLNNHGLRLGDNAEIARDLITDLAGDKRVLIDYSQRVWLVQAASYDHPDRTWADLARFFAYPFTLLWVGAGLTLALFLWRGSVRFGPVLEGQGTLGASKSVMIGARVRLMRLTGQDGALVGEYARARVSVMAHRLLGPAQVGTDEGALLRLAERRDPALRAKLEEALDRIYSLPKAMTAEAAITYVDELETLLEQLSDDT